MTGPIVHTHHIHKEVQQCGEMKRGLFCWPRTKVKQAQIGSIQLIFAAVTLLFKRHLSDRPAQTFDWVLLFTHWTATINGSLREEQSHSLGRLLQTVEELRRSSGTDVDIM